MRGLGLVTEITPSGYQQTAQMESNTAAEYEATERVIPMNPERGEPGSNSARHLQPPNETDINPGDASTSEELNGVSGSQEAQVDQEREAEAAPGETLVMTERLKGESAPSEASEDCNDQQMEEHPQSTRPGAMFESGWNMSQQAYFPAFPFHDLYLSMYTLHLHAGDYHAKAFIKAVCRIPSIAHNSH